MDTLCRCGKDLGHAGQVTGCGPRLEDVRRAQDWAIDQRFYSVAACYARVLAWARVEEAEDAEYP